MMLNATGMTVRFGGLTAVDGVDLQVDAGQVHAVIGPNGSGKSTLFNAITGYIQPDKGVVTLGDRDLTKIPAHRRVKLGLSRTFQTPRIDPAVTVREAVLCGFYPRVRAGLFRSLIFSPSVSREDSELRSQCGDLLDRFGLAGLADSRLGELPIGLVRIVDVARAMACQPEFILLDEPAAGLSKEERDTFVREVRSLTSSGVGVVLVEHNFDLVQHVSDSVTVLSTGSVIAQGSAADVASNPQVIAAYLGVAPADQKETSR